jgi:hypothetical protein
MRSAKLYEEAQWTLSKGEVDHPLLASSDVKDLVVDPPEEYDNGFSYSREVDDDDDEDGLHVMRIKVSWSTRGQEACEVLVRYVLQTEPKP